MKENEKGGSKSGFLLLIGEKRNMILKYNFGAETGLKIL